jgi:hypothetical protein
MHFEYASSCDWRSPGGGVRERVRPPPVAALDREAVAVRDCAVVVVLDVVVVAVVLGALDVEVVVV